MKGRRLGPQGSILGPIFYIYIQNQRKAVVVGNGVPQGSVLGPVLYLTGFNSKFNTDRCQWRTAVEDQSY